MARSRARRTSRWLVALPAGAGGAIMGWVFGAGAAAFAVAAGAGAPEWLPAAVAGAMGITAYLLRALVVEGAGDLVRRIVMGADQGTTPEYSVARGLEARGQFEAAVAAYREAAAEFPEEAEPLLLGARLLKDPLGRPEEALEWVERARHLPDLAPREQIAVELELVDLYQEHLGRPELAVPVLARLAARHAGTRVGDSAARRLRETRAEIFRGKSHDRP